MRSILLLQRRHVSIAHIAYIGRESNQLEAVEAGLLHTSGSVYAEYPDARRDPWYTVIVPALTRIPPKEFERLNGKSRRVLIDARRARR